MVFQTRIHLVLEKQPEEALDLVKNILRELTAETGALCLPSGHAMPLGAGCAVTPGKPTHLRTRGGSEETGSPKQEDRG